MTMPDNSKTSSAVDRHWRNLSPRDQRPQVQIRTLRQQLATAHLFWREVGGVEQPPLVLLHGTRVSPSLASQPAEGSQWLPVLEPLADRCRGFAIDLPGCGESSWTPPATGSGAKTGPFQASIADYVRVLADWQATVRLDRFWLAGHSIGAWIASRYALAYPDQVAGLVILAPEGVGLSGDAGDQQRRHQAAGRGSWTRFRLRLGASAQTRQEIAAIKAFCQASPEIGRLLYGRSAQDFAQERLDEVLGGLACPVRILTGTADDAAADARAKTYAALAHQSHLTVIPTTSPDLLASNPEAIADSLASAMGMTAPF